MDTDLALLLVVTATALAVVGWAGRKRFPLRIGVGNFFRRKTQVAIVVTGLLIGTAIVTSSFVIQRTFDAGRDLGSFVQANGSAWDGSGLAPTEAVINEKLAAAVEASRGDGLTLVFGGPRGPLNVTVAAIVKDAGRGAWNDGSDLFVP